MSERGGMNELQRQAYLQALGLSPWVAQVPLPGGRQSELLDWPQQEAPVPAMQEPDTPERTEAVAPPTGLADMLQDKPDSPEPAAAAPRPQPSPAAPAGQPLTLQLISVGDTVLVVQQADPGAPDLGRDAQQLLTNLARIFAGRPRRLNRFAWPMLDQPDDALAVTFQHFVAHLRDARHVLLCVDEDTAGRLNARPRYRAQQWNEQAVLAVSSLDEMLAQPRAHKSRSWRAILESQFAKTGA